MPTENSVVIYAVSWTETCVGLIFFSLRFFSNWKFVGRFRWDFLVAALTVATETAAQIFLQLSLYHGMGRHKDELSSSQIVTALKWGWVFQLLAIGASMLGKFAIMAFLIQIRGRHERKPWLLIILGVLIAMVNITVMGTILGQCQPMRKLWDDSVEGTCDPGREVNQNYSFFQASFNTVSDAVLATYPIHLFWRLQMKLRIKVGLSILMGFGWIAAVCSAVKAYELKALTETTDVTYALTSLLIWASTEAWIIIVVGCVPPIRPLMERVLQRFGLVSKKSSTPYYLQGPQIHGDPSNCQSTAYGGRKPFRRSNDRSWLELTANGAQEDSNERIVDRGKDVLVTTNIETHYEDVGRLNGRGSDDSYVSGDGPGRGQTCDTRQVI